MSNNKFDEPCDEIAARRGAAERIGADVDRVNRVLELEKLRARTKLTQAEFGIRMGLSRPRLRHCGALESARNRPGAVRGRGSRPGR